MSHPELEAYIKRCFEEFMNPPRRTKRDDISIKKERINLKSMSPEERKEYTRMKGREYKAKSRKKYRDQAAEEWTLQISTIRTDSLLGDCRELTSALEAERRITPGVIYKTTENFLQDMFNRYPDFEWFMRNDPRTQKLLKEDIPALTADDHSERDTGLKV